MSNLDFLLSQGEPEKKKDKQKTGLDSLRITNYAFEKAYAYARLACKAHGGQIECGGYLTTSKEANDRIARDAFLAKGQDVLGGLYTLNAEDVIRAGREIDASGHKVLGWWHSHGHMKTFFSPTDDNGQLTVLNEIAPFNYVQQINEGKLENVETRMKDGKVQLFERNNPQKIYELDLEGKNIINPKLSIIQDKRIGFAYGLVVNAWKKREPYVEIATRDFCAFCRTSIDESFVANLELFDDGPFILDEKALAKEIKDRVRFPKYSFFSSIFGSNDRDYSRGYGYGGYGGNIGGYSGGARGGHGYYDRDRTKDKKDDKKNKDFDIPDEREFS